MGRYDSLHGDEDILAAEYEAQQEAYADEHTDDYKYTEEWINEP